MSRAANIPSDDERSRKEILRGMACEDPDENPAVIIYRQMYEDDYDERPWEDES